jgi:hypothetical protein
MATEVLECDCRGYLGSIAGATYQDETYGKGKRVHNPTVKEETVRCTVCLNERKKPGKALTKKELKALKDAEKAEKKEKSSR